MVVNLQEVMQAALALPRDSRAALAEELLRSLDDPKSPEQAEIVAAWESEIEDRISAYEQGLIEAIPAEEVMRKIRTRKKP